MRTRRMTIEQGRRVGIDRFPQLPQKRKRQGHETAVLRQGLPVGTLWQLHLQCFR